MKKNVNTILVLMVMAGFSNIVLAGDPPGGQQIQITVIGGTVNVGSAQGGGTGTAGGPGAQGGVASGANGINDPQAVKIRINKAVTDNKAANLCTTTSNTPVPKGGVLAQGASTAMARCIESSNGNMTSLKRMNINWVHSILQTTCSTLCEKIVEINEMPAPTVNEEGKIAKLINSLDKNCLKPNLELSGQCVIAAYLIDSFDRNWDDPEKIRPVSSSSSGPAVIAQGQNGLAASAPDNYGCKSAGIETLDYDACKDFSDYSQGLEIAHKAVGVGQNLYYQNKAMDTQMEASKNMSADATAALKAQKSNFKDQQEYFSQNSAIEASKGAILASKYGAMPTYKEMQDKCSGITAAAEQFNSQAAAAIDLKDPIITVDKCKSLVAGNTYAFSMNGPAKDKMMQKLVNLGVNTVAEGTKAYFAGKRADQVGDAIANVNNFNPTTTPGLEQAIETSFCQMNPNSPKCIDKLPTSFSMVGDNIVDFGGNGTGTVYSPDANSNSGSGTNANNGTTAASKGKSTNTIGSAITAVDKGNGLETVAGAAVTQKGNAPGGGGGGGGGGSAGGGGGGGGGPLAAGDKGGVTAAIQGKTPSYGGGGISSIGGMGIKGGKQVAAAGANPFGDMFGKNKGAGDKNVNFRGPASDKVGDKGDNLFKMISNRYTWANDKKLMLEYEEAK